MNDMLSVKGLHKTYPGFVLDDVSFSVPKGAVVGFIGRNGAGKSTTIKSILHMVHPESGEILFEGRDIRTEEKNFKENTGVVLGGTDFYLRTRIGVISDVVRRFYAGWDKDKYSYYCNLFHLDSSKKVSELSSGMRVKFLIAMALSHNAKLLIMDEPTSGLDPVSRDELTELFRSIVKSGERSILFSTHITSDLEKCASHIVFIQEGKIVSENTLDAFCTEFSGKGKTLEDIIVAMERRPMHENAII